MVVNMPAFETLGEVNRYTKSSKVCAAFGLQWLTAHPHT